MRNLGLIEMASHVPSHNNLFVLKLKDFSIKSLENRIGDVLVSVLASSAVDRGVDPRLGQTKDYEIGIYFPLSPEQRRVASESG